jgi:hypothetical protein
MLKLQKYLSQFEKYYKDDLKDSEILKIQNVYPYTDISLFTIKLISDGVVSFDDFLKEYSDYIKRNKNINLYQMTSPTEFGITWGQNHILELIKYGDKSISKHYDLFVDGIRLEVKASRVVKFKTSGPLVSKMLSVDSDENFDMNFQQIKLKCCDFVILIGVWIDDIKYWIISSEELKENKYYSNKQHKGNEGEGQIHFKRNNIDVFKRYEVNENELLQKIKEKYDTNRI